MEDHAAFRDAVVEGIRIAGCDPVRAEGIPAAHASPRSACLDGVRSTNALVLLLGERYGFVVPSGLSAIEEEYEEAKRDHNLVLVFLEKVGVRESRQEAFVGKIQEYVISRWRRTFREPDELASLVQEAVSAADLEPTSDREVQGRGRTSFRFGATADRRVHHDTA